MRELVLIAIIQISLCIITCSADTNQQEHAHSSRRELIQCPNEDIYGSEAPEQLFRAAVLEYIPEIRGSLFKTVEDNLAMYQQIAEKAAENGVNVLVFPEEGLTASDEPVLTSVPDPKSLGVHENNPCNQPTRFESSFILRKLSCIAKENSLYIVANLVIKQRCTPEQLAGNSTNRKCPRNDYFVFNTNVVLDPQGNYIARYKLKTVYFDTPHGRFGIFTRLDIMYKSSANDLVEKYHVNTAILPTSWHDELPMLTGIQLQDAWSYTHNVNLLASSIHRPTMGTTGSGIYSGYNSVYTSSDTNRSRLLIASIPVRGPSLKCNRHFEEKVIDLGYARWDQLYISRLHFLLKPNDFVYVLKKKMENQTLCKGQVCCTIDYKITADSELSDKLIVIVRDGYLKHESMVYEQVCVVATLSEPYRGQTDSVKFSTEGLAKFERLSLSGNFRTNYVYANAAHRVTELLPRHSREFNCNKSDTEQEQFTCKFELLDQAGDKPLSSFGMYGGYHDCDNMPGLWYTGHTQPVKQLSDNDAFGESLYEKLGKISPTGIITVLLLLALMVVCILVFTKLILNSMKRAIS